MRILTVVLLAASLAACNRKVEVGSAPAPSSGMSVHLTNNTNQAVQRLRHRERQRRVHWTGRSEQPEVVDGLGRVVRQLRFTQGEDRRWIPHVHEGQRHAELELRLDRPLMREGARVAQHDTVG